MFNPKSSAEKKNTCLRPGIIKKMEWLSSRAGKLREPQNVGHSKTPDQQTALIKREINPRNVIAFSHIRIEAVLGRTTVSGERCSKAEV